MFDKPTNQKNYVKIFELTKEPMFDKIKDRELENGNCITRNKIYHE